MLNHVQFVKLMCSPSAAVSIVTYTLTLQSNLWVELGDKFCLQWLFQCLRFEVVEMHIKSFDTP